MSGFDGPEIRPRAMISAFVMLGVLAMAAVVFVLNGVYGGGGSEAGESGTESSAQASATASMCTDTEDGEPWVMSLAEYTALDGNGLLPDHLDRCVPKGTALMIVRGLDQVRGVYSTRDAGFGVVGLAVDDAGLGEGNRCHVSESGMFQTKGVQVTGLGGQEFEQITIDVGVTASGQPFATAVREEGSGGTAERGNLLGGLLVTHVYEPSAWGPDGQDYAEAELWVREFPNERGVHSWAGVATFSSLSYNQRDYLPFDDDSWEGDPLDPYTIQVWCR